MHLPDLDQVAVVGSGLVGEQLVRMLRERGVKPALATEPIACTLAFLAVPADAAAPLAIDFVNMGEPLQHNVFRHESDVDCTTGHTAEEQKLIQESRTLLDLPHLPIAATCMRVPVRMAHLESITVEISRPSTRDEIAAILAEDSCITVLRDECPTSRNTEGQDDVLVGHIRMNSKTSVSLVAAGDQLRIGAALNAIRIAECLPH
jgi:aspartate-semialdehyde dehydrogenase